MWLIMQRWTYPGSGIPIDMVSVYGTRPEKTDAIDRADELNRQAWNQCRYFVIHKSELPLFNLPDPNP